MTWDPIRKPQDKAEINGVATPGYCEVLGANAPRKWDEQQGYAYSGAWLVFHGNALSHFSLVFKLYEVQDWEDWEVLKPMVMRAPHGKRPKALTVVHPVLDAVGVHSMVVEDVIGPMRTDDRGEWSIEVRCIEWRAIMPALSKPDAAAATEVDPDQVAIALKESEYQAELLDGAKNLSIQPL